MHQEHVAGAKVGHQIFGAAAEPGDGLALQSRREILLEGKAQVGAAGLGFENLRPFHNRLQAAADSLDFGQFGHAGSFSSSRPSHFVQVIHLTRVT
jgi:hypothetical protein